jgi:hypothetical protein
MNDSNLSATYDKLRSEHTERSLIGCYLIDPKCFRDAEDLRADVFTRHDCRTIFLTMREIWRADGRFDAVSVAEGLERKGQLEDVGGPEGLVSLAELVPAGYLAERHLKTLEELRQRRALYDAHMRRAGAAADLEMTIEDVLELSAMPAMAEPGQRSSTAAELLRDYPALAEPLIDGLLRVGEVGSIISASKVGKSWLVYSLILSFVAGRRWLDTFQTHGTEGRVLLCDTELAPETLAYRLARIANALHVDLEAIGDRLQVVPFREPGCTLEDVERVVRQVSVDLVVIDAAYRAYPDKFDENSNSDVTRFFNRLVRLSSMAKTGILLVHHSSKGDQSGKSVRDVGSGAGAWSRAADVHLGLREHEEPDAVVFDGVVRSWPPVEPFVMRFDRRTLTWGRDDDLDVSRLKGARKPTEQRAQDRDDAKRERAEETARKNDQKVMSVMTVHGRTWLTLNSIKAHARLSGSVVKESLVRLLAAESVVSRENGKHSGSVEYLLASSLAEVTEFERQRDNATGQDKNPPHPPDGCPVPSRGADRVTERDDNPVCPVSPVCPVDEVQSEQKKKNGKKSKSTTSTTRRRKVRVVVDVAAPLAAPAAVDVAGDDIPEVVADVSEGVPF